MPASPSSAAQAARERIARRLRDLRAEAGITGGELARRAGWTHPKTSRLENARTPPTPADIRAWCAACGAHAQADDLIAASRDAEEQYTEWRRRVRTGLRTLQDSYRPLFEQTRLFRIYSGTLVPGLLQTEGYARALLSSNAEFLGAPDDSEQAAAARVDRSRIIHRSGRRFSLLMEEAVLTHQLGTADAMAAQLGHLLTAGALPSVSLGIIPAATRSRGHWPMETFHMYDQDLVSVELLSARVTVTEPSEIALYETAFARLKRLAVYGAEARALVVRAIGALA
ncbi:helix-turn-helix domain-containing protein [Streptomyces sp. 8L]|uniref:helix-turn-helix domain-containing protein n=1 Tax=Streptomyces sp. 8L TaxID=2877242 RepID=UPI001CD7F27D|nr:helix-turn-helix transcriptional regulator [Streptomyces sp. 8L]MCA1219749.1 helix-turn-helix transcriptional regulator [Streptomyces sp. 8L]